ncbi:Nicotinamide-nucleotide adenylyltransferase, NadR family / Ribosylnicotinamide kinase [Stenotrophomonas maltophilia]|nr:Nicotinamide-nucleotide adenylyltransferase, NadR family / Ribosylnicotinamide kinase [Stenotrophomonas maltophilia]
MPLPERAARGLVVGKFCPLHLGHERLIDFAATRCQQLLVIGWSQPGFAGYSAERRERWLRARFPQATVAVLDDSRLAALCTQHGLPVRTLPQDSDDEQVQRDFTAWLCLNLFGGPVQAVYTGEDYGDGFAQALATHFGTPVRHERLERALDVAQACGTQLRTDPHAHRHGLAPQVYADHVQRVAFIGGESSGKTTLARVLAGRLQTAWVPEYGRTLWGAAGGRTDAGRSASHCNDTATARRRGRAARASLAVLRYHAVGNAGVQRLDVRHGAGAAAAGGTTTLRPAVPVRAGYSVRPGWHARGRSLPVAAACVVPGAAAGRGCRVRAAGRQSGDAHRTRAGRAGEAGGQPVQCRLAAIEPSLCSALQE